MGSNPTSSVIIYMQMDKTNNLDLNVTLKVEITGKNSQACNKFLNLFKNLDCAQNSVYWKTVSRFNKKNFITVLKSPHVNKTAQEQFEYRIYSKCIIVHTFKPLFFLLLIKNLQGICFSNITLKVTLFTEGVKFTNKNINLLEYFNSNNIKLHRKLQNTPLTLKYTQYIEILDLYGEIYCKKIFCKN